ncbi:toll/interleukin-1 receptor domain-containing protein [uncultured Thiodictyon sp.]|uniref:toll/interleukin-1 receptor domain-containing protein n=1 Tax=uncultured Thiodictyon sp. TaxID=1846217 RepID=UPI003453F5E4
MFNHDIFISYSHTDGDWAKRLNDSLTGAGRGFSTFFDNQSLRAGDDWEAQIHASLMRSGAK